MTIRVRRVLSSAFAVFATLVFVTVASTSVAAGTIDNPVDAGDVQVVAVDAGSTVVSGGASGTVFTLQLPEGAACPGDSRNDQWRVQSYIVPVGVDPGELFYESNDPAGDGNWSLYGAGTNPYVDELTLPNTEAGQEGLIGTIRPLSFAVFPPGLLPEGEYTIGVTCTFFREPARFWDTQIRIIDDPTDEPAALRWEVLSAPEEAVDAGSGGNGGGLPQRLLVALVAAGAAAVLGLVWRLTADRPASTEVTTPKLKEHP